MLVPVTNGETMNDFRNILLILTSFCAACSSSTAQNPDSTTRDTLRTCYTMADCEQGDVACDSSMFPFTAYPTVPEVCTEEGQIRDDMICESGSWNPLSCQSEADCQGEYRCLDFENLGLRCIPPGQCLPCCPP